MQMRVSNRMFLQGCPVSILLYPASSLTARRIPWEVWEDYVCPVMTEVAVVVKWRQLTGAAVATMSSRCLLMMNTGSLIILSRKPRFSP